MNDENLEKTEQEMNRLLEDLSKVSYGSDDSKRYLEDLKELSVMATKAHAIKAKEEKDKKEAEAKDRALELAYQKKLQEADDKAKERKTNRILAWIDGGVKIVVAGTAIAVACINNRFTGRALGEVLNYESSGEYIASLVGKTVVGNLFRRK